MKRIKQNKYKGSSLIEILLYIGLTSTILLSITLAYTQILSIRAENRVNRELESQAAFVIDQIEREVLTAQNIVQPAANTTGSALELQLPSQTSNSLININNSNVQLTKNDSVSNLTSDLQVSDLLFTHRTLGTTPQLIDYSFTLRKNTDGKTYEVNYAGTVSIRR